MVAATDAALSSLPSFRLAAMSEQATDAERVALDRYRSGPQQAHARWALGRVLFGALTSVAVARTWEESVGGRWWVGALLGMCVVYGILMTLATAWSRAEAPRAAPALLRATRAIDVLLAPVSIPLAFLASRIGARPSTDTPEAVQSQAARRVESEVGHLVANASQTGEFGAEPAEMIRNVLEFKDLRVREVMVPRIKVVSIEASTPVDEAMRLVSAEGHSRYPVYRGRSDNVVGVLYAKDLFQFLPRGAPALPPTVQHLVHAPINFVPETQLVSTVLREMRQRRQHMALVIDEFGGFAGVVTLEDILEEIVGDINDEHDEVEAEVQDLGEGRFLVDASIKLSDLEAQLGQSLGGGDYDVDSLGGLLVHEAGRVPSIGERIVTAGLEFLVREADAKRVTRVEIVVPPPSSGGRRAPAHSNPSPAPA
ncbi:MAG TPA: hemolysin family protein [Polyangiaceae bacterium]|nr:hemolysin family protein [Polyangiaceae bacterium]